jgi:glycosyltransferase involved in cell wall biosynthesis
MSGMGEPRMTVLMPVFNGESYLRPAIESMLGQTFGDFEFLIIDDGSTDGSLDICRSYRDERIRLLENGRNLGLIATLNRGLDRARGEYIARMDCDDVSFPRRLERQLAFLEQHPDVGLCGTWYERVSDQASVVMKPPGEDSAIRFLLVFDSVFAHNTIVFRRSVLERHQIRYDPDYPYAEDYELWTRCARYTRLANLPEVHLLYRYHPENTSRRYRGEQVRTADRVRSRYLDELGIRMEQDDLDLHLDLLHFEFRGDLARLARAGLWLTRLGASLRDTLGLPEQRVYRELGTCWYGACGALADLGWPVWRLFLSHPAGRHAQPGWKAKLLARCLKRRPIGAGPVRDRIGSRFGPG